jgi:trehalose 6-phosphate synthase/phosphatase
MPQVVIVSNRLPVSVKRVDGVFKFFPSDGGLATGMSSFIKQKNNKWVGFPGIPTDDLSEAEQQTIVRGLAKYRCYPVFLTKQQVDDYYNGYSNSVLWPFFHNMPTGISPSSERHWKAYKDVNSLFADVVLTVSQPKSTIWVHDYQLLLLPQLLREERPASSLGFFMHIPWPSAESFVELPHARRLLRGVLGADVVGFHIKDYAEAFVEGAHQLRVGVSEPGQVILEERVVRVTDFPLGIDYQKFADASSSSTVQKHVRRLHRKYGSQKIILTVDRLDPTKGFVERLEAYHDFLLQNPIFHRRVKLVMLAVPSRAEIDAYRQLKEKVEELVHDINKKFSTRNWSPIEYFYKSVPFEELAALYHVADVAFVAPIKDGMNLVAKEYIASKHNKNGVLILSETAGAAQELTSAILVNPAEPQSLTRGLSRALTMSTYELEGRIGHMQKYLSNHTVHHWAKDFMHTLQQPVTDVVTRTQKLATPQTTELREAYQSAKRRLLLLDYDGVLTAFTPTPEQAKPSANLMKLLTALSNDPANDVVLVSGRSQQDLQRWFGKLPVTLAAEHGASLRPKDGEWHDLAEHSTAWKRLLMPALRKHARETPGALVEEKQTSLVWHYRTASPYHAQKNIVILKQALRPILKQQGLQLFIGKKVLEIKRPDVNKGIVVKKLLRRSHQFWLSVGDDYTDEDMFKALPPQAYTIKVGRGKTAARYRVGDVEEVLDLLASLAKS